jgi:hypothetical protein
MANIKLKRFKCAGETYVVGGKTTILQAKKGLKKESKETLKEFMERKREVGLTSIQNQRVRELRRIINSC